MTAPQNSFAVIQLGTQDGLGSISVSSIEFQRFENSLTLRIDQLTNQWKHIASPNALREKSSNGAKLRRRNQK